MANSASGRIAQNCVLDDCIFESPGVFALGSSVKLVQLLGAVTVVTGPPDTYTYYPHQFCVVRRCLFDGETIANLITAIDPGLGRGFIAEENEFSNIFKGIELQSVPAIDLIFWNNKFDVVQTAISLMHGSTSPRFGRAVIIDNAILLARGVTSGAIQIGPTSGTDKYFDQVIVRKNVIAADLLLTGSTSGLTGVKVWSVTNAIVENNVISDCETAGPLDYRYCTTFKAFNNQNRAGTLLHAYNADLARYLMELQDFTEDALLGF
jgi:hypothetical protein